MNKTLLAASLLALAACGLAFGQPVSNPSPAPAPAGKLTAPAQGRIRVAFVLTEGAVMIDFAGPWEVFQDVMVPSRGPSMEDQHVFELYTVSDSKQPIRVSGGLLVTPDYTFADAPEPRVVVVPAQSGGSAQMLDWIRKMTTRSDVVMSVCTGAFKLAQAGVLDGKKATTHHSAYTMLQAKFPRVQVQRDMRYVRSDPVIFTAGGLSSGIDLAMHIVDLYFGRDVAAATARQMEYEGRGWMGDGSSRVKYSIPVVVHSPADGLSTGVLGNWRGSVVSDEGTVEVALHIWPDKNGRLVGTADSPDQDVTGLPVESISFIEPELHWEIPSVAGSYEGKLNAQQSVIEGTWKQNGATLPLVLKRVPN